MKQKTSHNLKLINKGGVTLKSAKKTANYILQQMSQGEKFDCEHHGSDNETVFVFIANGLCCTLHLQPLDQEGGEL